MPDETATVAEAAKPAKAKAEKPAKMRTIYEISNDILELYWKLEEIGGDISDPEVEAEIDALFASLGAEKTQKVDNYCALIKEVDGTAALRKAEAARISAMAKTGENLVSKLKERLHNFLTITHKGPADELPKMETARFKIWIQKNGAQPGMQLKVSEDLIPAVFKRIEMQPVEVIETDVIRAALENPEDPLHEQAKAIAEIPPRGTHLRIK